MAQGLGYNVDSNSGLCGAERCQDTEFTFS